MARQITCSLLAKMADVRTEEREEELVSMWEVWLFLYDMAAKYQANQGKTLLAKREIASAKKNCSDFPFLS